MWYITLKWQCSSVSMLVSSKDEWHAYYKISRILLFDYLYRNNCITQQHIINFFISNISWLHGSTAVRFVSESLASFISAIYLRHFFNNGINSWRIFVIFHFWYVDFVYHHPTLNMLRWLDVYSCKIQRDKDKKYTSRLERWMERGLIQQPHFIHEAMPISGIISSIISSIIWSTIRFLADNKITRM